MHPESYENRHANKKMFICGYHTKMVRDEIIRTIIHSLLCSWQLASIWSMVKMYSWTASIPLSPVLFHGTCVSAVIPLSVFPSDSIVLWVNLHFWFLYWIFTGWKHFDSNRIHHCDCSMICIHFFFGAFSFWYCRPTPFSESPHQFQNCP